jgi:hypothetical protein
LSQVRPLPWHLWALKTRGLSHVFDLLARVVKEEPVGIVWLDHRAVFPAYCCSSIDIGGHYRGVLVRTEIRAMAIICRDNSSKRFLSSIAQSCPSYHSVGVIDP